MTPEKRFTISRGFVIRAALAAVVVVITMHAARFLPGAGGAETPADDRGRPGDALRAGASALRIQRARCNDKAAALADPANGVWKAAKPLSILLNTTPRIYVTDKVSQSAPPALVRCADASDGTAFLLTWKDATKDQPVVSRSSPAGRGARLRVVHSDATDRFYDTAAVMVPIDRNSAANPCIQMGEKGGPVNIYFWNAVRGPAVMSASGRGTTARTGKSFPARATYTNGEWKVTFVLPKLPNGSPVAFAVWDGSKGQRGGLKYFSLWHTLR
ncbi:MAG: hypothetical protein Q7T82_13375 [Armatimonadota bacterium]|nr:hypothetical protein [Armatimonadota bacterium]